MYGKIFASLYQGTLRGRAHEILVFTNMIACADQTGVVDKHPRAIAEEIGLDIETTRRAIESLEAPDPESRSAEHGGARICKAFDNRAWGWQIVNYVKYRSIRSEEDRREQNRLAQERYRTKNKPPSAEVSNSKPPSAESKRDKPKEREREKEKEKDNTPAAAAAVVAPPVEPDLFDQAPAQPAPLSMTRSWMDWKLTIGKGRVYIDREGNSETHWAELYSRAGWDEFTKAWEYCASKTAKPGGKVFLSNMMEVIS
jgi:hypothetical protein